MTQPKPSTDTGDVREFIAAVANDFDDNGYHTIATAVRSLDPDIDPTDISGGGAFTAERVAGAITTSVIEHIEEEVAKRTGK